MIEFLKILFPDEILPPYFANLGLNKNNRNDGDDNVNIDVVQGRSEVESEEKDLMNISKKDALASDTLDHG